MTTYTETKILTLTSQSATIKRNNTFLSNLWYDTGLFIKDEPDILHKQITLTSAQIPYSFYVVNYTNNTLVFKISTSPTFTSVNIPVGNYNGNNLCTQIKSLFQSSLGIVVSCVLSSVNGILTITCLTNDFTISSQSTCLSILGFTPSTTYTSVSGILTAPYPLNLLGIKVLQVRSSTLNMLNYSSIHNGITTLLGTIPVSAVPFGMIDYKDRGDTKISFSNGSLDEFEIEILDGESGEYINFNNQDWTMTFSFTITRLIEPPNKMNFSDLLRGAIGNVVPPNVVPPNVVPPKDLAKKTDIEQPPSKDLQELQLLTT